MPNKPRSETSNKTTTGTQWKGRPRSYFTEDRTLTVEQRLDALERRVHELACARNDLMVRANRYDEEFRVLSRMLARFPDPADIALRKKTRKSAHMPDPRAADSNADPKAAVDGPTAEDA